MEACLHSVGHITSGAHSFSSICCSLVTAAVHCLHCPSASTSRESHSSGLWMRFPARRGGGRNKAHSYVCNEQQSCFQVIYAAAVPYDVSTKRSCQLQSTRYSHSELLQCILLANGM